MTRRLAVSIGSLLLATPATAFAQAAPAAPAAAVPAPAPAAAPVPASSGVQLMTLQVMRDKGILSQAEYDGAVKDLTESTGALAAQQSSVVMGKWATTMYGFVEDDNIYDTTRAFNDLAGMGLVPRANTQGGQNGRFTMGVRNSRIGFRLKAPDLANGAIRTSAMLEMDFFGNQPGVPPAYGEDAFFTNPTFRVRHSNLKVETPVFDILAGQYWQLFGWQSVYQPNTVEIQGVPGEIYSRTPQVRISKTIHADQLTFEAAVAATRPVQRDSAMPDGQAGLRLALESWRGVQTVGATGTQISPLSIAATGLLRHVAVDNFASPSTYTNDLSMGAFALDTFIPIIPGSAEKMGNSLSLTGEFASGYGIGDMYTGLTGITGLATGFPATAGGKPYQPDIEPGVVAYNPADGSLHPVQWTVFMVGAQYYLPGVDGKVWISGNYSHASSSNTYQYFDATSALAAENWFDVNLFVDPTAAVRVGAEYANFNDMYIDGQHAIDHRAQLSAFYIF